MSKLNKYRTLPLTAALLCALLATRAAAARAETVTVVTQHPQSQPAMSEQQLEELRGAVKSFLEAHHGAGAVTFVTVPPPKSAEKLSTLLEPLRVAGKAEILLFPWITTDDDSSFRITLAARWNDTKRSTVVGRGETIAAAAVAALERAYAPQQPSTLPPIEPAPARESGLSTARESVFAAPSRFAPLLLGGVGIGLLGWGIYEMARPPTCEAQINGICGALDTSRSNTTGGLLLGLGVATSLGATIWLVRGAESSDRKTYEVSGGFGALRGRMAF